DRGLSSERALASIPGTFPNEERGLNDVHYIVPGAGGMGELLTNSWV
ncbi:MAG: uracil phosphoribosyltransferase, partial [Planctomycetes bacterium]|nr:uracil phosphoribosyltransferase [Planctomycetota bacterium]